MEPVVLCFAKRIRKDRAPYEQLVSASMLFFFFHTLYLLELLRTLYIRERRLDITSHIFNSIAHRTVICHTLNLFSVSFDFIILHYLRHLHFSSYFPFPLFLSLALFLFSFFRSVSNFSVTFSLKRP